MFNLERAAAKTFFSALCATYFLSVNLYLLIESIEKIMRSGKPLCLSQSSAYAFFSSTPISVLVAMLYTLKLLEERREWQTMLLLGIPLYHSTKFIFAGCFSAFVILSFLSCQQAGLYPLATRSCAVRKERKKDCAQIISKGKIATFTKEGVEVSSLSDKILCKQKFREPPVFGPFLWQTSLLLLPLTTFSFYFFLLSYFPTASFWYLPLPLSILLTFLVNKAAHFCHSKKAEFVV